MDSLEKIKLPAILHISSPHNSVYRSVVLIQIYTYTVSHKKPGITEIAISSEVVIAHH